MQPDIGIAAGSTHEAALVNTLLVDAVVGAWGSAILSLLAVQGDPLGGSSCSIHDAYRLMGIGLRRPWISDRVLAALALGIAVALVAALAFPGLRLWVDEWYNRYPLLLPLLGLMVSLGFLRLHVQKVKHSRDTAWNVYEFLVWGGVAAYQVYRLAFALP